MPRGAGPGQSRPVPQRCTAALARRQIEISSEFQSDFDLSIAKRVPIHQKYSVEVRGEAFNLLNKPSFFVGDMDINSSTFGRITSVNIDSRVVQLSARFEF